MEKITNVVALEMAINALATVDGFDSEAITKLQNIKASYLKKSSTPKKPTANQVANEGLKSEIIAILGTCERMTVTEITKSLNGDYTSQKISSLVRQLVSNGCVARTEEKRKAYFSLVTEDSAQYLDREITV